MDTQTSHLLFQNRPDPARVPALLRGVPGGCPVVKGSEVVPVRRRVENAGPV